MAGRYGWSRSVGARVRTLRALVRDTQQALEDVNDIINIDQEIHNTVQEVGEQSLRSTALVILGSSPAARVRLLHCLLGHRLLPEDMPRGCRWIRIQHGSSTQVRLSLGNSEFELVEELHCSRRAWDVLPTQDFLRKDNTELTTILEVELNNQFLKDGLKIIIPPDILDPGTSTCSQLKAIHSELYSKRSGILRSFNCVYLYALDRTGKNMFSDNISCNIVPNESDEDFWSTFNLYTSNVRNSGNSRTSANSVNSDVKVSDSAWTVRSGEPYVFNSENCLDLHQLKEMNPHSQPLFILFNDAVDVEGEGRVSVGEGDSTESGRGDYLTEVDREILRGAGHNMDPSEITHEQIAFMNDLLDQWQLMTSAPKKHYLKSQYAIVNDKEIMRTLDLKNTSHGPPNGDTAKGKRGDKIVTRSVLLSVVVKFATQTLQSYLLEYGTKLSEVLVRVVQQLVVAGFALARQLQLVPRKIQFVARHEQRLYESIEAMFSGGQQQRALVALMEDALAELHQDIDNMDWTVDDLPSHQDPRFASRSLCSSQQELVSVSPQSLSDGEEASTDTYDLTEYDIIASARDTCCHTEDPCEESIPVPPASIPVANDLSLSSVCVSVSSARSDVTCASNVSFKHATADVQQTVLTILSRKISLKLVKYFDCLKESYFGTLQRCIESLEWVCRREVGGRPASEAMRRVLSVGRHVTLTPAQAFSLLRTLLYALTNMFYSVRVARSEWCCGLSGRWRARAARDTARVLSAHRLARIISHTVLERLSEAHARYQSALATLEGALTRRLHHTEDVKLTIRKKYAPLFARLLLESTSMCDVIRHGAPDLGREIGRGQYGVVYGAATWGGRAPVAVKSVVPSDDYHYHELAMEFYYTRSIPPHPRIVPLYGSVVARLGGGARCVQLVTARRVRDLHAAVRAGLSVVQRMTIAADIVEGIRYLHSLGLVHRDIKLKNVLLDGNNRASLSDLGFCAAGALMSGSVVGTPVHMAPELLDKDYTCAVDVYAFGILFWYLCAGDVKLPAAFETFHNKDQLWTKVKKGLRPERLPHFTDECWAVMEACWHPDPAHRALLGNVQQQLATILEHALAHDTGTYVQYHTDDSSADEFEEP